MMAYSMSKKNQITQSQFKKLNINHYEPTAPLYESKKGFKMQSVIL